MKPHLKALEAEAISIIREAAAGFLRPVMMFSIGKDSTVLLHLAAKAFAPSPIPFPLLQTITKANQVWATDITYIPMKKGFMYLIAVMDRFIGKVLS